MGFFEDLVKKRITPTNSGVTTLKPIMLTPQVGDSMANPSSMASGASAANAATSMSSTSPEQAAARRQQMLDAAAANKARVAANAAAGMASGGAAANAATAASSTSPAQSLIRSYAEIPKAAPVQPQSDVDYTKLIENATAQQRRNASVNTAQTRTLAQEQAMQAGAKVGSADAANYVNRALASADAANVAGAQGLQDTVLAYQKSKEGQQNWQKSFEQSSKQADQANERARYDQIVSAIGTDNPEALSFFSKQYLAGVPIDKAYSQTVSQGFKTKTAKDKAYEELATWKPQIDEYKRIQSEQGQVAADNYLKANPIPTEFIPTNTASDAGTQSQSIVTATNWISNPVGTPPVQDIKTAVASGNTAVINKLEGSAMPIGYGRESLNFKRLALNNPGKILKDSNGGLYYVSSVSEPQKSGFGNVYKIEIINLKTGNVDSVGVQG